MSYRKLKKYSLCMSFIFVFYILIEATYAANTLEREKREIAVDVNLLNEKVQKLESMCVVMDLIETKTRNILSDNLVGECGSYDITNEEGLRDCTYDLIRSDISDIFNPIISNFDIDSSLPYLISKNSCSSLTKCLIEVKYNEKSEGLDLDYFLDPDNDPSTDDSYKLHYIFDSIEACNDKSCFNSTVDSVDGPFVSSWGESLRAALYEKGTLFCPLLQPVIRTFSYD